MDLSVHLLGAVEGKLAILDIMIYVWSHDATVTVNQVSGTPAIYAQWVVTGTSGDTIWVNIHDLASSSLKLYRNNVVNIAYYIF